MKIITWIIKLTAAVILFQTLYFKFTSAPESVYIFSTVGMESWGRYGSGVAELVAVILLLIPRLSWAGALIGMGTMAGALFFHLTILGVVVQNDGGTLFVLALVTMICCAFVAIVEKAKIPIVRDWLS